MSRRKGGVVSDKKLPGKLRLVQSDDAPVQSAATRVASSVPAMPDGLPKSLHGLWGQIVADLDEAGLLSRVDGPTLELALRHYAVAVASSDDVLLNGPSVHDEKNGREAKNPSAVVFAQHSTAFLEYAKQLGLSFVSRARVSMGKEGDDAAGNPFALTG